jgi:predicted alpha/beta hydrolase family esterase
MNAFIFHGTGGYPEENWFPWLKSELEKIGIDTIVPHFPTPEGQSFDAWMKVLKPDFNKISAETILIGHSLGGIFTLKLLETLKSPVRLSVTVGTPIGIEPIKNFEQDKAFAGFNFDWQKIKQNSKNFIVYHSDNDPYVGLENGQELVKNLGVDLTFIPNAGHFNKAAGYIKFEELLNKILNGYIAR